MYQSSGVQCPEWTLGQQRTHSTTSKLWGFKFNPNKMTRGSLEERELRNFRFSNQPNQYNTRELSSNGVMGFQIQWKYYGVLSGEWPPFSDWKPQSRRCSAWGYSSIQPYQGYLRNGLVGRWRRLVDNLCACSDINRLGVSLLKYRQTAVVDWGMVNFRQWI